MKENSVNIHRKRAEPWTITLVNTGDNTMTGGRMKRVSDFLKDEYAFCLTYGDGLADINISKLLAFHKKHGKDATISATYPPARFGALVIENEHVTSFKEKPEGKNSFINGGFFVLSPKVLERITGDDCIWEHGPLKGLADDGSLMAYKHEGFWQPMDTLRDKNYLENLWANGAPWKTW
jgi:glucose-1-phosphate cytidylyltransferase